MGSPEDSRQSIVDRLVQVSEDVGNLGLRAVVGSVALLSGGAAVGLLLVGISGGFEGFDDALAPLDFDEAPASGEGYVAREE